MALIQRLTADRFADYGHVGRAGEGSVKTIRNGEAVLTQSPVPFQHDIAAKRHALEFFQVKATGENLIAAVAERHPHSAQMFIPMSVQNYLVVVWKQDPDSCVPEVFLADPEDIVIYNPGVWHHGIIAIGTDGLFASTMWKTDGGSDVQFLQLAQPVTIDLAEIV